MRLQDSEGVELEAVTKYSIYCRDMLPGKGTLVAIYNLFSNSGHF